MDAETFPSFPFRLLADGRLLTVEPTLYGARLCIGDADDAINHTDVWCYPDQAAAIAAMDAWNGEGEPTGWHRHPSSGRRRPGGDPAREHVRE
jgi:hypothetical protein